MREIGALLEPRVDKGRSARNHLRALGATTGITDSRVDEVLELVGLSKVAKKSAGSFSLGMGQRLGIAGALLGDPDIVMLDEPVNGLDPDGVLWIRGLLRDRLHRHRHRRRALPPRPRQRPAPGRLERGAQIPPVQRRQRVHHADAPGGHLPAVAGVGIFTAWVLAAVVGAALALHRRDV